jgi:CRP-like cAMP-binding protein
VFCFPKLKKIRNESIFANIVWNDMQSPENNERDIMLEVLRNHLTNRLGNDLENLDKVLATFKYIKTKRNEQILQQGETCKFVYFVAKGCLQVYIYDKDLNETTRDIVVEDNWCSELLSFGSGMPATENIRTVEPCDLFAIDKQNFQTMMETVPQFDKVYKQILESSYANSVYRINTFVSLSALERIKWLMNYRPMLMTRLSSKLIASYLGINKDVYSRLKSKL